jgi:hypothetical protein
MRILKWVTDNGLEAVISPWGIIIPFIAITIAIMILCSCGGGGGEYKPTVIKNSHGATVIFTSGRSPHSPRRRAITWIEDNTDKKIVSVSFDWHGSVAVVVYEETVGDPKKPSKCKECGQPKLCEEPKL